LQLPNSPGNCCQASNLRVAAGRHKLGESPKNLGETPRKRRGTDGSCHGAPDEYGSNTAKEQVADRFMVSTKLTERTSSPVADQIILGSNVIMPDQPKPNLYF
jgi:hypothetical protein